MQLELVIGSSLSVRKSGLKMQLKMKGVFG
jgi:hypothetical protein